MCVSQAVTVDNDDMVDETELDELQLEDSNDDQLFGQISSDVNQIKLAEEKRKLVEAQSKAFKEQRKLLKEQRKSVQSAPVKKMANTIKKGLQVKKAIVKRIACLVKRAQAKRQSIKKIAKFVKNIKAAKNQVKSIQKNEKKVIKNVVKARRNASIPKQVTLTKIGIVSNRLSRDITKSIRSGKSTSDISRVMSELRALRTLIMRIHHPGKTTQKIEKTLSKLRKAVNGDDKSKNFSKAVKGVSQVLKKVQSVVKKEDKKQVIRRPVIRRRNAKCDIFDDMMRVAQRNRVNPRYGFVPSSMYYRYSEFSPRLYQPVGRQGVDGLAYIKKY